jgi:hypothetical protein
VPTTTIAEVPPSTAPPGGGFTVGSGAASLVFPEKPGLTVSESSLKPYTGPKEFRGGGTYVFENCYVTDTIRMYSSATANVTFRNCKFTVDSWWGILAEGGTILVEHSLFDGTGVQDENFPLAMDGAHGTVRYSEFRNNTDNIRLGGNTLAEWNYIHAGKAHSGTGNAHSDGIEIYNARRSSGVTGPHTIVRNNYIDIKGSEGATGCVNITTDFGPVDGVRVEGNVFMPGGTYSLYVRLQTTSGPIKNVEVVNNRWFASTTGSRSSGMYGTHSVDPESSISQWSGNTITNLDGSNSRAVNL